MKKERSAAELTDKDLICLARHLQHYISIAHYEEADAPNACEVCSKAPECYKLGTSGDWMDAFTKLSDIAGINIIMGTTEAKKLLNQD